MARVHLAPGISRRPTPLLVLGLLLGVALAVLVAYSAYAGGRSAVCARGSEGTVPAASHHAILARRYSSYDTMQVGATWTIRRAVIYLRIEWG